MNFNTLLVIQKTKQRLIEHYTCDEGIEIGQKNTLNWQYEESNLSQPQIIKLLFYLFLKIPVNNFDH